MPSSSIYFDWIHSIMTIILPRPTRDVLTRLRENGHTREPAARNTRLGSADVSDQQVRKKLFFPRFFTGGVFLL